MINNKAFTLIELLIAIAIIGILVTIAAFGLTGARETARDAKRKTDLQTVKAALELRYADCGDYPSAGGGSTIPNPIRGDGSPTQCAVANTYFQNAPADPQSGRVYYYSSTGTSFMICTSLENAPSPVGDISGCGSCGSVPNTGCNFKVSGP